MDQNQAKDTPKRGVRADDGMPRQPTLQEANRALVRPSVDPAEVKRAADTLARAASAGIVPAVPEPAPVAPDAGAEPAKAAEPTADAAAPPAPAWGAGAEPAAG